MNAANHSRDDIVSVYDILDVLWKRRAIALILAVIGISWIGWLWVSSPSSTKSHQITFAIFSGGSAFRSPGEIADILVGRLQTTGVTVLSGNAENPVIVSVATEGQVQEAIDKARAISQQIIAESEAQAAKLAPILTKSEAAVAQYWRANTFLDGVQAGLVDLVRPSTRTVVVSPEKIRLVFFPMLVCGFLFFFISLSWAFLDGWNAHRKAR